MFKLKEGLKTKNNLKIVVFITLVVIFGLIIFFLSNNLGQTEIYKTNIDGLQEYNSGTANDDLPEFYGTTDITIRVNDELDLKKSMYRILAKDRLDGNITKNIRIISNNVNTSIQGNYEVKYEVKNSRNKTATIIVPVHVIENSERKIQRTLYVLPDLSYLNDSGFTRGNKQDAQNLGIYLPANKTVQVKQINNNLNKDLYVDFFNRDRLTEASVSENVNKLSSEYNNYDVKTEDKRIKIGYESEDYIQLKNETEASIKLKDEKNWETWEEYTGKSYDSIPMIKTLFGVEEKPILEIIINDDVKNLDYFTYGDDDDNFKAKWRESGNKFAILDGDRVQFIVPDSDRENLGISKKTTGDKSDDYRHDNFNSISDILHYYDEIVETYDEWIGLSYNAEETYNQNVKTKFLIKVDEHGYGLAAYAYWNYINISDYDELNSWMHNIKGGWVPFHEIGHGYQGYLKNKELYLTEISNNFLAYYYQKNNLENEDWLYKINDEKIESLRRLIKNPEEMEETEIIEESEDIVELEDTEEPEIIEESDTYTFLNKKYYNIKKGEVYDDPYNYILFVYINLLNKIEPKNQLNKIEPKNAIPYTYKYARKLYAEKQYKDKTATDIIAKGFSEGTGYNVIPYLEDWGLEVSDSIKKEIYDKDYPIVYYLRDLVENDEKAEQVQNDLGLMWKNSLVSNDQISSYNKKGNLKINLDLEEDINLEDLFSSKLQLKFQNNIVREIDINSTSINISDIPIGTYMVELDNDSFVIPINSHSKYITIKENSSIEKDISIYSKHITNIKIAKDAQTSYYVGDNFNPDGMSIIAYYNDGSEKEVQYNENDFRIINGQNLQYNDAFPTGFEFSSYAYISFTYTDNETQDELVGRVSVVVKKILIKWIEVEPNTYKEEYVEGQNFDPIGIELYGVYNNGDRKKLDLSDKDIWSIEDGENLQLDQYWVTLEYYEEESGKSFFELLPINVVEKQITEIEVTKNPKKMKYIRGENFDPTGMEITAYFNDDSEITIPYNNNEEQFNIVVGEDLNNDEQVIVNIYYYDDENQEYNTRIFIEVTNNITGIAVENPGKDRVYIKGTPIETVISEEKIKVMHEDNETVDTIDMTAEGVEVTGYDTNNVGNQTITVSYKGFTATFKVTVTNNITGIAIKNTPSKLTYIKGEALDLTGGKIELTYENGEKQRINMTLNMVSGYNANEIGEQEITVTFVEFTDTFKVTVTNNVTRISITTVPNKLTYVKGEALDLTGGKIEVVYQNGTETIDMTAEGVEVTGYDTNNEGNQTITVSYKGFTATFKVIVRNNLVRININNLPTKISYIKGESLDLTGGKIEAIYENNDSKIISMTAAGIEITGYSDEVLGTQILTVHYMENEITETATFSVTVTNNIDKIEVVNLPFKIVYFIGEQLDLTGGEILVTYQNGEYKTISMTEEGVSVSGYNSQMVNVHKLTVFYNENNIRKRTEFNVTVVANNVTGISITNAPNKLTYVKGEDLDLTGGKIEVTYENGDKQIVDIISDMVSGYNTNELGEQEITVTFVEFTATFKVTVTNNVIGISIITAPNKSTYVKGEDLDLTGGKIEVTYENGDKQIVDIISDMVSGYNTNELGEQEITVTFVEFTATFKVTVTNNVIGISIITAPNKLTYVKGEDLDLTGGKIEVTYENGDKQTIDITSEMVTGYEKNTLGNQELIVTYEGNIVTLNVTVINKSLERIEVAQEPLKTEYIEGESFNSDGMRIKAIYNNESEKEVTNYAIINGDNLRVGQESVVIKYIENGVEKTIEQAIVVKEKLNPGTEDYEIIEEEGIKYIGNIVEKTTIKQLKENIKTNGEIEIYKENVKIQDEDAIIGTGMTIKIKLDGQEETYEAVIKGDLTGDGQVKMADLLKLARYHANLDENLTGAYLKAGDVVQNGKIGMPDILKLSRVLAELDEI